MIYRNRRIEDATDDEDIYIQADVGEICLYQRSVEYDGPPVPYDFIMIINPDDVDSLIEALKHAKSIAFKEEKE